MSYLQGLTAAQIAWDLLQIPLSVGAGYLAARFFGESLQARWAEKRRVRDWKELGDDLVEHIRALMGPLYGRAASDQQLNPAPEFAPGRWTAHLREILSRPLLRNGDGILQDRDFYNRQRDTDTIVAVTRLGLQNLPELALRLTKVHLLFREALPHATQLALSEAVLAVDRASVMVKPLPPPSELSRKDYYIRATVNARNMLEVFDKTHALLLHLAKNTPPARSGI